MIPKPHIRRNNGMEIMSKLNPSKPLILIALMAAALFLAACSPSAEKLNNQGNEAYAKEDYMVALHEYQSAQIESPELAEPYYNAANALYREGAYAEALEQMQMALQFVDNESLAEQSIYNLGNTFYNSQELDPAIESYISALLLDPNDQDAKYNLELALQQQQQQEQEQQEQENQDQQQDQSESSENQDEEQQSQEDQSQNGEDQQEEEQENQSQNSDNQEQDQENESEESSAEQSSENEDQQNEENQDQNNGNGQPQESEEQSDQESQPGELPPGQRMTEEQARQLLEALAQDMDTLQERLGEILRVQIPPPAQDW
jgi:Ca-activated chloride channel family protein